MQLRKKITTNGGLLVASRGLTTLFLLACECRSPISQDPVQHIRKHALIAIGNKKKRNMIPEQEADQGWETLQRSFPRPIWIRSARLSTLLGWQCATKKLVTAKTTDHTQCHCNSLKLKITKNKHTWRAVSELTLGPTGLMEGGRRLSSLFWDRNFKFSRRFSQNNYQIRKFLDWLWNIQTVTRVCCTCLGFSCLPCFNSWRTLHSCDFIIVTGCLNMEAVCLIGGMTERSFLNPLAKSGCAFLRFFLKSIALILPVLKSNVVKSTVSPKYLTNCGLLRNFFPLGL